MQKVQADLLGVALSRPGRFRVFNSLRMEVSSTDLVLVLTAVEGVRFADLTVAFRHTRYEVFFSCFDFLVSLCDEHFAN